MAFRPAGTESIGRADWKKIVFALADYAYRGLAAEATWDQARVLVRAAISFALSPETANWDPREETWLKHLGSTMRDLVIVMRDEHGTGSEAREEAPDWTFAARTYSASELQKLIAGPAGLPIATYDYFRTRRRVRRHSIDVIHEIASEPGARRVRPSTKASEAHTWEVILSSLDQDNFEEAMPRALLEEFIREQGGDPEALWKRLEAWLDGLLAERARR